MKGLSNDQTSPFEGVVIETKIDLGLGIVISVLVKEGLLRKGDIFECAQLTGKIRLLRNSDGTEINNVKPSYYCEIIGLKYLPIIGEIFITKSTGLCNFIGPLYLFSILSSQVRK